MNVVIIHATTVGHAYSPTSNMKATTAYVLLFSLVKTANTPSLMSVTAQFVRTVATVFQARLVVRPVCACPATLASTASSNSTVLSVTTTWISVEAGAARASVVQSIFTILYPYLYIVQSLVDFATAAVLIHRQIVPCGQI